jgi:hypothetical protein
MSETRRCLIYCERDFKVNHVLPLKEPRTLSLIKGNACLAPLLIMKNFLARLLRL